MAHNHFIYHYIPFGVLVCHFLFMAYKVTRTIRKNGRSYTYTFWQESYRQGDKVRTRYLGKGRSPLSIFAPVPFEQQGLSYIDALMEKYPDEAAKVTDREPRGRMSREDKLMEEGNRLLHERNNAAAITARAGELFKESTGLTLPAAVDNPTPVDKASLGVQSPSQSADTATESAPSAPGEAPE